MKAIGNNVHPGYKVEGRWRESDNRRGQVTATGWARCRTFIVQRICESTTGYTFVWYVFLPLA